MLKKDKKYAVVGQATYKVYYVSDSKAECFAFLQKQYPSGKRSTIDSLSEDAKKRSRFFCGSDSLLPEAMRIIGCPARWPNNKINDYFEKSLKSKEYLLLQ